MGDEDDGGAGVLEAAEGGEEFGGFLGGEDGGGFVEDEEAGGGRGGAFHHHERFDDFDALLGADVEVFDAGVEGEIPGEALHGLLGERLDGLGGAVHGEGEIFKDGEGGDEFEVLVDHADAEGGGLAWGADLGGGVVDKDLAGGGRGEAEEDVHESGFAGAVFAEEGVDFRGFDFE